MTVMSILQSSLLLRRVSRMGSIHSKLDSPPDLIEMMEFLIRALLEDEEVSSTNLYHSLGLVSIPAPQMNSSRDCMAQSGKQLLHLPSVAEVDTSPAVLQFVLKLQALCFREEA